MGGGVRMNLAKIDFHFDGRTESQSGCHGIICLAFKIEKWMILYWQTLLHWIIHGQDDHMTMNHTDL